MAAIDALLPQTQCTRCGFDGCLPYARAVATGEAQINRCPPGGDATIDALAALLDRDPMPLAADCGPPARDLIAWIDAQVCIGCARCLPPCPVDAIIGAARLLHTVIPGDCTGCELCLPACPVDCIHMQPRAPATAPAPAPAANRHRYRSHQQRLQQRAAEQDSRLAIHKQAAKAAAIPDDPP